MLKKLLSIACLTTVLEVPSFAQTSDSTSVADSTNIASFKPHGGNATVETGLNFIDWNETFLKQARFRIFLSSSTALRLGINGSIIKEKSDGNSNVKRSYKSIQIAPGIEKHFKGTNRLSPYFATEVVFNKVSSNEEGPFYSVENGWDGDFNRAHNSFGINAIVGTDFYVAKHFYIGIEVGLGFAHYKYEDIVTHQYSSQGGAPTTSKGHTSNSFGTFAENNIRIGYAF